MLAQCCAEYASMRDGTIPALKVLIVSKEYMPCGELSVIKDRGDKRDPVKNRGGRNNFLMSVLRNSIRESFRVAKGTPQLKRSWK